MINKTQRSAIIYDYPANFNFSKPNYPPYLREYQSKELSNKLDIFKNNLFNESNTTSVLQKSLVDAIDSHKEFFRLRMESISSESQHKPKMTVIRKSLDLHEDYEIILFRWEVGVFNFQQLGVLYIPKSDTKITRSPIAVHPMGCGSYLGRNDNTSKLHNRMASLASNGVASLHLLDFAATLRFHAKMILAILGNTVI